MAETMQSLLWEMNPWSLCNKKFHPIFFSFLKTHFFAFSGQARAVPFLPVSWHAANQTNWARRTDECGTVVWRTDSPRKGNKKNYHFKISFYISCTAYHGKSLVMTSPGDPFVLYSLPHAVYIPGQGVVVVVVVGGGCSAHVPQVYVTFPRFAWILIAIRLNHSFVLFTSGDETN